MIINHIPKLKFFFDSKFNRTPTQILNLFSIDILMNKYELKSIIKTSSFNLIIREQIEIELQVFNYKEYNMENVDENLIIYDKSALSFEDLSNINLSYFFLSPFYLRKKTNRNYVYSKDLNL